MKLFILLSTLCFIALAVSDDLWLNSYVLEGKLKKSALKERGFDVYPKNDSTLLVIGCNNDEALFKSLGYNIIAKEIGEPFYKIQERRMQGLKNPPLGYDTPQDLFDKFTALAELAPDIAQLEDLTDIYNTEFTVEGQSIYALKISENVTADEDQPNILLVANHHSRELITPQLALDAAERLVNGYLDGETTLTELVEENQIYIIWTMNPDGLDYTWTTNAFWRKNRRNNGGGAFGIDLNRNYPFGWDFPSGGSTNPFSNTFRGRNPASEAETQTMIAFQRDRRFAKLIDWHSFSRDTRPNYGGGTPLPTCIKALFDEIGDTLAEFMSYVLASSTAMGGDIHTAYHDSGTLATLIETGTTFQPPADAMREEVLRVWPGTLYYLTLPIPLSGHVTDRDTGEPVEAFLDVDEITWFFDEERPTNSRTGSYFLWLPEGTWTVSACAEGYRCSSQQVDVTEEGGVIQDFELRPTSAIDLV